MAFYKPYVCADCDRPTSERETRKETGCICCGCKEFDVNPRNNPKSVTKRFLTDKG